MNDPIARFSLWFDEAKACEQIADATAMSLATVGKEGKPSSRIVLLKAHDERGFVFYTNMESRKSRELLENPHAALCFHWAALERQVRIEGKAERVGDEEADAYFDTRPRESKIGAWASKQSEALSSRDEFMEALRDVTQRYEGRDVPRPPHWSGWRVVPRNIEFWEQGEFRLHIRNLWFRDGDHWRTQRLYP